MEQVANLKTKWKGLYCKNKFIEIPLNKQNKNLMSQSGLEIKKTVLY